jgi:hypothetical protein
MWRLALALCSIPFLLSCSSIERTTETHTTHFIDAGDPVNNGAKVIDDDPTLVGIYRGGKAVGTEERRLNGMMLLTPDRYRELLLKEHAFRALANEHKDDRPFLDHVALLLDLAQQWWDGTHP